MDSRLQVIDPDKAAKRNGMDPQNRRQTSVPETIVVRQDDHVVVVVKEEPPRPVRLESI
jgi:hypothetical protein